MNTLNVSYDTTPAASLFNRQDQRNKTPHRRGSAVKTSLLAIVTTGLAISSAAAFAAPLEARHLQPSAPRTIIVLDSDTPPVIRAGLLQSTLILLPPEEKVATVFGGDTVSWVFDGGHVASRFISIKPKTANSTTDVHIVSDHGNEYTLQLREVSGDGDGHFDSKVFIEPGDKAGKDKLAQMPVFVPASEVQAKDDQLKKVMAAAAIQEKAAATEAEQFRSNYPGQLHFDYTWDKSKGKSLGLEQIWRDGKFTYLRGTFQETPVLYEQKDGKGSLINFDFSNGLYTVPKTVEQGYLAIGKQKVEFRRVEGGN
jgi:type IV secretory pathway VirB9-like protein